MTCQFANLIGHMSTLHIEGRGKHLCRGDDSITEEDVMHTLEDSLYAKRAPLSVVGCAAPWHFNSQLCLTTTSACRHLGTGARRSEIIVWVVARYQTLRGEAPAILERSHHGKSVARGQDGGAVCLHSSVMGNHPEVLLHMVQAPRRKVSSSPVYVTLVRNNLRDSSKRGRMNVKAKTLGRGALRVRHAV